MSYQYIDPVCSKQIQTPFPRVHTHLDIPRALKMHHCLAVPALVPTPHKCCCLCIQVEPSLPLAVPKSVEQNKNSIPRALFPAWLGMSHRSKSAEVEISLRSFQSELLLVSPDLSRSCFSASACFSSSGTRRRLELMNQLLICAPVSAPWRNLRARLLT